MEMYVWEVKVVTEWLSTWKSGGKEKKQTQEDSDTYTVAAESGRKAIIKAEKIFMSNKPWEDSHIEEDETDITAIHSPNKVIDVVGLTLKETLNG